MTTFIEILEVLVFGIVEGFAERLPVSGTGHMTLLDEIIPLSVLTELKDMLMVVIQLGVVLAVIALYFHRLNPFSSPKTEKQERATARLWTKILMVYTPAAIIGLLTDDWIEAHPVNGYVVAATLIIYGVLFIVIEWYDEGQKPIVGRAGNITYWLAFCISLFQVLSLVPETPQSGATVLGAILLGCPRGMAAGFSSFLGIPVMFGVSLLKVVKSGLENFKGIEAFYLLLGVVVIFLISVYSIKFLPNYIRKNDFTVFRFYWIRLEIVMLIYFAVIRLTAG